MMQQRNACALLSAIGEVRDEWIADAGRPAGVRRGRRLAIMLAAALMCAMLTVSALAAADVDGAYELIYALSPTIAQRLKPVKLSCVDNGIELSLLYADVEGSTARVYLSLRDLEGERVDATTDLYDSYEINLPGDLVGHCAYSHFDEQSRSACFLVEVSSMQGEPIENDKLTFSLDCFLSGREDISGDLGISLSEADPAPETRTNVVLRGGDGSAAMEKWLVPTKSIGVMDGAALEDSFSASCWDEGGAGSYTEQAFDLSALSAEEIANLHLFGSFTSSTHLTRGNWQITFGMKQE